MMARFPILPDKRKSNEPKADTKLDTINGMVKHLSARMNISPGNSRYMSDLWDHAWSEADRMMMPVTMAPMTATQVAKGSAFSQSRSIIFCLSYRLPPNLTVFRSPRPFGTLFKLLLDDIGKVAALAVACGRVSWFPGPEELCAVAIAWSIGCWWFSCQDRFWSLVCVDHATLVLRRRIGRTNAIDSKLWKK